MISVRQYKETFARQITGITKSCCSLWRHQVLSWTHKNNSDSSAWYRGFVMITTDMQQNIKMPYIFLFFILTSFLQSIQFFHNTKETLRLHQVSS